MEIITDVKGKYQYYAISRSPKEVFHFWSALPHNSTKELAQDVFNGGVLSNLRGEFAWIYKNHDSIIAAVDHLATIPLYYSNNFIGPVFSLLAEKIESPNEDMYFSYETKFLRGFSLSQRTSLRQVKRILPAHRLNKNQKQVRYIDILEESKNISPSPERLKDAIEQSLLKIGRNQVILYSGGIDSLTLATVSKKLGLCPILLNFYSSKTGFSEKNIAEKLAREQKQIFIDVKNASIESISPEIITRTQGLWSDQTYIPKRIALQESNLLSSNVVTGEVADQLYGTFRLRDQLSIIFQKKNWTWRDIAIQYINQNSRTKASGISSSSLVNIFLNENQTAKDVYHELVNTIETMLQSSESDDIINTLNYVNLIAKGPLKPWCYSQDKIRFHHPFINWNVIIESVALPSYLKINDQGKIKLILYELWKNDLPKTPWVLPKSSPVFPRHLIQEKL